MNPFKFIALLWVLHSILAISAKADSAAENLYSLFKLPRQEKPYACRFDLTFTPTEHKACEDLELKLRVTEEHLNPHDTTDPLFFDVYEKLPKACHQFQRESKNGIDAVWPCVFWGIKEALKYELLGKMQGCGNEDSAKIYRRELDLFQESCLSYLEQKVGLAKAASLQNEVCRRDEFLKFKNVVDDPTFLSFNSDLLTIVQPGYAKDEVPDYFYLLNSCDKQKVKRKKTYTAPPIPKRECEEKESKNPVHDLAKKTYPVLAEIAKDDPEPSDSKSKIKNKLKEVLKKKINSKSTSEKTRSLLERMLKDDSYIEKTAAFYESGKQDLDQIVRSFEGELRKTDEKLSDAEFGEYSLEEQAKLKGSDVGLEDEAEKTNPTTTDSIPTPAPSLPEIEKEKQIVPSAVPNTPTEKIPPRKSKKELYKTAQKALQKFKTHQTDQGFDYSSFFMQTEMWNSEKKLDWKKEYQRLEGWKKHIQKVQQENKNETPGWQLYFLTNELHRPFLKNYASGKSLFLDCFSGKGCNCEGQTKFLESFLQMSGYKPAEGEVIATQNFSDHVQLVVWNKKKNTVKNILTGEVQAGIIAPLYHPMSLVHGYLEKAGIETATRQKDFLIAEKNVHDPMNKGEKANAKDKDSNAMTELPSSDVSFGRGREIPKFAQIEKPLDPLHSSLPTSNPMRGDPSKKGTELKLDRTKISTPKELDDFELAGTEHPDLEFSKVKLDYNKDKNNFSVYFRNKSDADTFLSIKNVHRRYDFISELWRQSLQEYVNSPEINPSLRIINHPEEIDKIDPKKYERFTRNYMTFGFNLFALSEYQLLKTGEAIGEKTGVYNLDYSYRGHSIAKDLDVEMENHRQLLQDYGAKLTRSLEKLKQKVKKDPSIYLKNARKLPESKRLDYLSFLNNLLTNGMDHTLSQFKDILEENYTFKVYEKGIARQTSTNSVESKKNENSPEISLRKERNEEFEDFGLEPSKKSQTEIAPSSSKKEEKEQIKKDGIEIKPKKGVRRDEPNSNKKEKEEISPYEYLWLTTLTKSNIVTENLIKEVLFDYSQRKNKMSKIIPEFGQRFLFELDRDGPSENKIFEKQEITHPTEIMLNKKMQICYVTDRSSGCKGGYRLSLNTWRLILESLKVTKEPATFFIQYGDDSETKLSGAESLQKLEEILSEAKK